MISDRFKFRVWDTEKKELLYGAENAYDYMRPYTGEKIIEADCFGDLLEDKRYIVEQCTGLKDKNGRLIYEGDIVFYSGVDLWYVIFKEKYCAFELARKDGYGVSMSGHKEMTVVGNIHENPGIMEDIKE